MVQSPTMPDTEAGRILSNLRGVISDRPQGDRAEQQHYRTLTSPTPDALEKNVPRPNAQLQDSRPPSAVPTSQRLGSSHAQSPQIRDQAPIKRSRSRPTKSCEQCRKKKLKCNRELPCSNCLKGGRGCYFEHGPEAGERESFGRDEGMERGLKRFRVDVESSVHHQYPLMVQRSYNMDPRPPSSSYSPMNTGYVAADVARKEFQDRPQSKIGPLATYPTPASAHTVGSSSSIGTPPSSEQMSRNYASSTLGRVHVKGSGSRYVGINDRWALFDHFEDCRDLIVNGFKDDEMAPIFNELSAFQKAFQPRHPRCNLKDDAQSDRDALFVEMLDSVPAEHILANLQEKYITTWETMFRVVHMGTLAKDCAAISAIKETGATTLPDHIKGWVLPQILCIMAIASRLHDPSNRASVTERISDEQINKDLPSVRKWLDGVRGKFQTNIHVLETRVLLLIARQANLSHPTELWRESGDLVRLAMATGLHQDPEKAERMSKFDKEMRRKLWVTIVELDMRFSLLMGFPCAISSSQINIAEILNVDDESLTLEMEEYPEPLPQTTYTQALPQIALTSSIRERLDVTNLLAGNLNLERDASLLLQHARLLERSLRLLPVHFKSSTQAGSSSNKKIHRLFTSIMLDVAIRRPLLALYRAIALSPVSEHYPEARKGAFRNSLAILAHLDALDPAVADLSTVKTRDYLNLFHILCKSDIMQATIILCYQIRSFNNHSSISDRASDETSSGEADYHDPFPVTKQSLTRVVENTITSMMQRLGEFGSDLKEVVPLSVLLQGVRSDGDKTEKKAMMVRGAERVLLECRKILPGIQDVVQQNNIHGHAGKRGFFGGGHHHAASLIAWTPPNVQDTGVVENGALPPFNDFNLMPGDDLLYQNFDFAFSDWPWDANQTWT